MNWVIDNSVVIKWFSSKEEKYIEQADHVLDDIISRKIQVTVPDLLIYELSNALLVGKKLSQNIVNNCLERFYRFHIKVSSVNLSTIRDSVTIAHRNSITIYDAMYVSIAKSHSARLLTADLKHHGKIKDGSVILLQNYPV